MCPRTVCQRAVNAKGRPLREEDGEPDIFERCEETPWLPWLMGTSTSTARPSICRPGNPLWSSCRAGCGCRAKTAPRIECTGIVSRRLCCSAHPFCTPIRRLPLTRRLRHPLRRLPRYPSMIPVGTAKRTRSPCGCEGAIILQFSFVTSCFFNSLPIIPVELLNY